MAKYRCNSTEPRNDGSGDIAWQIQAITDDDPPVIIPGRHATFLTPAVEVQAILDGPASQRGPKLIALLKANVPSTGWEGEDLDDLVNINTETALTDDNLDTFIESANPSVPGGYPIEFIA